MRGQREAEGSYGPIERRGPVGAGDGKGEDHQWRRDRWHRTRELLFLPFPSTATMRSVDRFFGMQQYHKSLLKLGSRRCWDVISSDSGRVLDEQVVELQYLVIIHRIHLGSENGKSIAESDSPTAESVMPKLRKDHMLVNDDEDMQD